MKREIFYRSRKNTSVRVLLSQTATKLISKAPLIGEGKEQWVLKMDFECVHCGKVFPTRAELMKHYDSTRHDKYSAWV
jgi:Zinc finger, C2H2 type